MPLPDETGQEAVCLIRIVTIICIVQAGLLIYFLDDHGSNEKSTSVQENNVSVSSPSQETGNQNVLFQVISI